MAYGVLHRKVIYIRNDDLKTHRQMQLMERNRKYLRNIQDSKVQDPGNGKEDLVARRNEGKAKNGTCTMKSPLSKNFSKKTKNFRNVQLNIFQVQQMFVVFLLKHK